MNDPIGSLRSRLSGFLSDRKDFALRNRTVAKFLLHLAIFITANHLAYLVRFEFSVPPDVVKVMRHTIPILLIAKAFAFLVFGLFRGWWRHVAIQDVPPVVAGCTLGSVLFAAGIYLVPEQMPTRRCDPPT